MYISNIYINLLFVQPCQPVISNTDAIPPVDNYTIFINGSFLEIARCSHIQSVDEGIYTVSVTANNIVGSSEKTIVDYSKLIYIFQIIIWVPLSLLDARWLQNVNSKNVDMTHLQAEVVFTTAACVEQDDLNVLIVYNNDTTNIIATATKSFFIHSLLIMLFFSFSLVHQ